MPSRRTMNVMPPCCLRRWTQPKMRTRSPLFSTVWRILMRAAGVVGSTRTIFLASSSFLSSASRLAVPAASSRFLSSSCRATFCRCPPSDFLAFLTAEAVAGSHASASPSLVTFSSAETPSPCAM